MNVADVEGAFVDLFAAGVAALGEPQPAPGADRAELVTYGSRVMAAAVASGACERVTFPGPRLFEAHAPNGETGVMLLRPGAPVLHWPPRGQPVLLCVAAPEP